MTHGRVPLPVAIRRPPPSKSLESERCVIPGVGYSRRAARLVGGVHGSVGQPPTWALSKAPSLSKFICENKRYGWFGKAPPNNVAAIHFGFPPESSFCSRWAAKA